MQNQNESFQRARAGAGHWGKACNKLTMPEITELSDQALLSQTRLLVQKERSLHVQILRHLREIEARQLYFSEGYASLFDYAVRGLGYSKGAAFRRIKAMRLCRDEPETLEKIKSGRLSLCAASQLQSFFEKQKKEVVRLKNDLKKASESDSSGQSIKQRGDIELKGLVPQLAQQGTAGRLAQQSGSALGSKGKPAGAAPGPDKSGGSALGSFWRERAAPQSNRAPGPDAAMQKQFMAGEAWRGPAFEAEKTPALEREKKLALIEKAEGCSSRETERLLLEEAPDSKRLLQKDQVRFLGEGRFELKAVIDGETRGKLERLKFLLSHKNPSMGYGELLGNLLDLGLKKHDPSLRGKKPSQKLSESERLDRSASARPDRGESERPDRDESERPDRSASAHSDRSLGAKIKAPAQALRLRPQSGSAPGSGENKLPQGGTIGRPAQQGTAARPAQQIGSATGPEKSGGSALGSKGNPAGAAPGLGKNAGSAPGPEKTKCPRRGTAARPAQQMGSALGSKGKPAGSAPGLGKNAGSAPGPKENKPPRGGTAGRPAQQTGSAPGSFGRERAAPQLKRAPGLPGGSRYIPAEVKRLVWARDQGRCSYVNPKTGRRCGSRYMIQMDHIKPFALGGLSTKENMRLLCAGHNRFRARQTFPQKADRRFL